MVMAMVMRRDCVILVVFARHWIYIGISEHPGDGRLSAPLLPSLARETEELDLAII